MTTPSSSIYLTSQSVPHKDPMQHVGKNGEYFYGENWHNITKNIENSDCNSNLVTKDLMHHLVEMGSIPVWRIFMEMIFTHTTSTSIVVPTRAYLTIKSPNYVNTSQRGTPSHTSSWKALMHLATM